MTAYVSGLMREIYKENNHKKPVIIKNKKHSRWSSGICRMCGQFFEMITFDHAAMHGFKNPTEMAKKGDIDWTDYV